MRSFATLVASAVAASAAPSLAKTVDLVFVIDQSGSMANEFRDLGDNLGIVFDGLVASPAVDSVTAGLVTYEGRLDREDAITLQQDLTSDVGALTSAFAGVSTRGGVETALTAVDAAIPGGLGFLGIDYRPGTVRSIVLITDEDADDEGVYTYAGQTGYAALGSYLDDAGYLNNVITQPSLFEGFGPASRPLGEAGATPALFSLPAFNDDPQGFLTEFTATKLEEILVADPVDPAPPPDPDPDPIDPLPPVEPTPPVEPPVAPIPLPASALLLGGALLGLGVARRRGRG